EMSRMRERGVAVSWVNAFDVLKAPAIGGIPVLGLGLGGRVLLWVLAAWVVYASTLGADVPGVVGEGDYVPRLITLAGNNDGMALTSVSAFLHDVFRTSGGQAMIVIGVGVGFLFALAAMMISVVSFPMLLDQDAGLDTAVSTSVKAVLANPGPM